MKAKMAEFRNEFYSSRSEWQEKSNEAKKKRDAFVNKFRDWTDDKIKKYVPEEGKYDKSDKETKLVDIESPENRDEYEFQRLFCYHCLRTITVLLMLTLLVFAALYMTNLSVPLESIPQATTVILEFIIP